jgi:glycine/serine hydroxymethyltransferase
MGRAEMVEIADIISSVISNSAEPGKIQEYAEQAKALCNRFPVYRQEVQ